MSLRCSINRNSLLGLISSALAIFDTVIIEGDLCPFSISET